jgi:hypothetical protein
VREILYSSSCCRDGQAGKREKKLLVPARFFAALRMKSTPTPPDVSATICGIQHDNTKHNRRIPLQIISNLCKGKNMGHSMLCPYTYGKP